MSRTHDDRRPLARASHDDVGPTQRQALQTQMRALQLQAAPGAPRSVRAAPGGPAASTAPLDASLGTSVRQHCQQVEAEMPHHALGEINRQVQQYLDRRTAAASATIPATTQYIEQGTFGLDMRFEVGVTLTANPVAAQQREHASKVGSQSGSKDTRSNTTTDVDEVTDETRVTGSRKDSLRVGGKAAPREGTEVNGDASTGAESAAEHRQATKKGRTTAVATGSETTGAASEAIEGEMMVQETTTQVSASWWWRIIPTTVWARAGTSTVSRSGNVDLGIHRYHEARPGASSNPGPATAGDE